MVIDPSQGAGRADLVIKRSQGRRRHGRRRLLLEVHPNPKTLSDSAQQLSLDGFRRLMAAGEALHRGGRPGVDEGTVGAGAQLPKLGTCQPRVGVEFFGTRPRRKESGNDRSPRRFAAARAWNQGGRIPHPNRDALRFPF